MFNKKFKLMATAIGLVAVLVGLMVMPGATQGSFSRQALVNALKAEISALLTAGVGEPLNLEAAAFFSSGRATSAYIPPHTSALSGQLIKDYLLGKAEWVFLGAVYVSEDVPQVLPKGLYYVKAINRERVALINQEGEVVGTRWIKWLADPEDVVSSYVDKRDYFVLTASSSAISRIDPGEGGGGTPPPPPPPPGGWKLSWKISVGVCTPVIQVCLTFGEAHI